MSQANAQGSTPEKPGYFRGLWLELREDFAANESGPSWHWHDVVTFTVTCVLLTVFFYWCRPGFFRRSLHSDTVEWLDVAGSAYAPLLPYTWWAVMSVTVRMVVPCLIIWFVFKEKPRDYGYRIIGVTKHAHLYLLMFLVMLPVLFGVSFIDSFQSKYPFYRASMNGLDHFLLYQLCYGIQFIALEAFFRGFLIFALYKRFGYYSLFVMVIPYCMIHFGKPVPETIGAILAGLLLGYLALKSKSWFYGALLHWSVGFTMDLFAIWQKGGFKD